MSCVVSEWCVPTVRSYYMIEACPPPKSSFSLLLFLPQTLFQRASISSPIFYLVFCLVFLEFRVIRFSALAFLFKNFAAISYIQQTITTY